MVLSRIKTSIKYLISYALFYTGVLSFIKYYKLRNRAVILTFHRVIPFDKRQETFSHDSIIIDTERFNKSLNFIKSQFNIIQNKDLIKNTTNKSSLKKYSCLIAFDDGWLDNYEYAFPALKSNKVPAIIFPAVDYVQKNRLFWQEEMGHGFFQLLQNPSEKAIEFLKSHNLHILPDLPFPAQKDKIINYVRSLKSLEYSEIDKVLGEIKSILGKINYGSIDQYLNWDQISEMSQHHIDFGSHACSHRILTRLDEITVREELMRSKQILTDSVGKEIDTVAYPNGNYNVTVGKIAKETGYTLGYGTRFGSVSINDNPYDLKRININDAITANNPLLLAKILGVF